MNGDQMLFLNEVRAIKRAQEEQAQALAQIAAALARIANKN